MANRWVTRKEGKIKLGNLVTGLNTMDDPHVSNPLSMSLMQGADSKSKVLVRCKGHEYLGDVFHAGYRGSGIFQWYPQSIDPRGLLYCAAGGRLFRLKITPPNVTITEVATSGLNIKATKTTFVGWGDYAFVFDGVGALQLRTDDVDNTYDFGIAKPPAPTAVDGGVGTITTTNGGFQWAYRWVREVNGERDYWGPLSDTTALSGNVTARYFNVSYTLPTDAQVNAIYFYRTTDGGGSLFYQGKVELSAATGIYVDNNADTNTQRPDYDVLDRISGIKYACVDGDRLIVYGSGYGYFYWSEPQYPQEFKTGESGVNQGQLIQGSGKETGIAALDGRVYLFRERGIGVFAVDSNGVYQQIGFYDAWGNIAENAVQVVIDEEAAFITFWDAEQHLCVIDGRGPRSLRKVQKYTGPYQIAYTDVLDIFDNQANKDYKKYISVGYFNNKIYCYYTTLGEKYNTRRVRYDIIDKTWYGPDKCIGVGPMITRLQGYGVDGKGDMLGIADAATGARLVRIDGALSDNGAAIEFDVRSVKLGGGEETVKEFITCYVKAKISKALRVDITTFGNVLYSYYLTHGGSVVYNGSYTFDSGVGFDDTSVPLYDDGKTYDTDVVFDDWDWVWYRIDLPPDAQQGAWTQVRFYDNTLYPFQLAEMRVIYKDRGDI